jgi:hypothetical protein
MINVDSEINTHAYSLVTFELMSGLRQRDLADMLLDSDSALANKPRNLELGGWQLWLAESPQNLHLRHICMRSELYAYMLH